MRKSFKSTLFLVAAMALPVLAHAAPLLSFTAATTAITDEMGPALTAGVGIGSIILGVMVGWKIFRRMAK